MAHRNSLIDVDLPIKSDDFPSSQTVSLPEGNHPWIDGFSHSHCPLISATGQEAGFQVLLAQQARHPGHAEAFWGEGGESHAAGGSENRSHQRWRSEDFGMDFLRFLEDVNGICMESSETFREKLDRNLEKFTEISWISEIVWLKCPKNILWTFFLNISETNHPKLVVSGIPYTFLALGSARFSGPHEGKPKVVRCSWRRNQPPAQSKRWPFWCSPFEKLGLSNWLRVWKRTQWSPQIFLLISHSQLCRSVSVSSLTIRWLEMIEGICGGTITLFHTVEMTLDTVIISKEYGDGS